MHSSLFVSLQIKGTFARRGGRRNPYKRANMCSNFLAVVCGPFPIRCVPYFENVLCAETLVCKLFVQMNNV